jgi:hypothetical protein
MKTLKTRLDFFATHPGMVTAELGVFTGDFSRQLIPYTSHLYLVDTWDGYMESGDKDGENIKTVENMEGVYYDLLGELESIDVSVIRCDSLEWLNGLEDDCLDCVYIDTSHTYNRVSNELFFGLKKVKEGGWISGHDLNIHEVGLAVEHFCKKNDLDIDFVTDDRFPSYFIHKL